MDKIITERLVIKSIDLNDLNLLSECLLSDSGVLYENILQTFDEFCVSGYLFKDIRQAKVIYTKDRNQIIGYICSKNYTIGVIELSFFIKEGYFGQCLACEAFHAYIEQLHLDRVYRVYVKSDLDDDKTNRLLEQVGFKLDQVTAQKLLGSADLMVFEWKKTCIHLLKIR